MVVLYILLNIVSLIVTTRAAYKLLPFVGNYFLRLQIDDLEKAIVDIDYENIRLEEEIYPTAKVTS